MSESLLQFAEVENLDTLESYSHQRVQTGHHPIRSITFISEHDPADIFRESVLSDFDVSLTNYEDFFKLDLTRRIPGKKYPEGHRSISGEIYVFSNEGGNVHTAFAISAKEFYELGILRYLESLPPTISTTYLSTQELRKLFVALDESVDGNIIVNKAVVKSPSEQTEITYRDSLYYDVFNEIDESNYIDKVQFELKDGKDDFEAFVTRNGGTRFTGGNGSIFFNHFLENLATLLSDKGELFQDRDRKFGSRDADPIHLEYEEGAIVGVEENERLIETLEGIKKSSVAVFHDNPYMHASVLDFKDGSTADVFLTSDQNISIVPGFKASRSSLSRICEQISEGFMEGKITTGNDDSGDFEDYFAPG